MPETQHSQNVWRILPQIGRMACFVLAAVIVSVAITACGPESEDSRKTENHFLPSLGANIAETSVSGISSGAYMAGQFQFAHGELVVGAAIIAGGPYGCAESTFADVIPGPGTAFLNLSKAVNGCMRNSLQAWGIPDAKSLARKAIKRAADGLIAPITEITSDKVYLFSGRSDRTVEPSIVIAARDFYLDVGIAPTNIKLVADKDAGHAFVTETQGGACETSAPPFVVDCDYDQAGALLQHIYGNLNPRSEKPSGEFRRFDQTVFTKGLGDHGMAVTGAAYIPSSCSNETCRLHIAFHGCAQNRLTVGGRFIEEAGFARWADTNRLIVLFPQTSSSTVNPQGCWDWWGFTSNDYLTRKAPQIIAVHRMLQHLAKARSSSPDQAVTN